ncbi:MAG: cell division topological specificity factor MinE [Litorivicinaceae bacterium]|jgi:cell division topological specificity factor|nr:cell division topological specificity factor MinE [Litorivicinus sp.]MBT6288198.1 cell division topological specificity factor MinE [Oceanospirillales bacterium]MCH1500887.1 cell division topological specificity factor MinE [Litorivicinaceae bacterium]MDA0894148.1 cell division topological specificity factor MinE [Pseudomonadota bacterium]NBR75516.1 cell division topological specificity factor MinE [Gammaproteobacteria bacterium]|tara:strand:- start:19 stop:270 length:252 start_codon:yes stop_codon:yes gene_type:complete
MAFFGLFSSKQKTSAAAAKERLQILISHERQNREGPDFLPDLQREILDVVKKYVAIRDDQVAIRLDRVGDSSVLELNVTLPER